jgi:hypothetical protein
MFFMCLWVIPISHETFTMVAACFHDDAQGCLLVWLNRIEEEEEKKQLCLIKVEY